MVNTGWDKLSPIQVLQLLFETSYFMPNHIFTTQTTSALLIRMENTMPRLSAVTLSLHAKPAELIVRIVCPCCLTGQRLRCEHLLDI